jgi:putative tryptophan/tyrosine transport system substrate-binding protein
MRNNFVLFLAMLLLQIVLGSVGCERSDSKVPKCKILIAQYSDHSGLMDARNGFLQRLKELGYEDKKNVDIDIANAHGSDESAQSIVNNIPNDSTYRLVLSLGTTISQMLKAHRTVGGPPVVYGVITDPLSAGLVTDLRNPGGNATASSDRWPYFEQMELIAKWFPNLKRIGIPYNPGEANSRFAVKQTVMAADSLHLVTMTKALNRLTDITPVVNSMKGEVDLIYIPACNTAMEAAPGIIATASGLGIPVYAGDLSTFRAGAFLALGVTYRDLGRQTADAAKKILNGGDAGSIPVIISKDSKLFINLKVAAQFKIEVPQALIAKADTIITG